ncbi:hypothetical protein GA830_10965 [Mesorhizobium sp. NBSH29]|uniref:hypothetical protein n=1 Tax=Mesorhizobium sp. NBSH29 TaxID=2654249 RepID=UPI00189697EA|nr:hypothetical protein [Mesorhizobium sp. NBSH29]QPC87202.1 hypothetical protein GA830_10965 [Mesorhizobium sp. NBSH29]
MWSASSGWILRRNQAPNRLAAVCPITNTATGGKFEVAIPRGVYLTGVIQSYQFRTLDWLARNAASQGKANSALMWEGVGRIEAILGVDRG